MSWREADVKGAMRHRRGADALRGAGAPLGGAAVDPRRGSAGGEGGHFDLAAVGKGDARGPFGQGGTVVTRDGTRDPYRIAHDRAPTPSGTGAVRARR